MKSFNYNKVLENLLSNPDIELREFILLKND